MAELDFYFNKQEKRELINFLLENNCKFVPDNSEGGLMRYDSPNYKELSSMEEIEPFLEHNVMFFIIHNDYLIAPFEMEDFQKDGINKYYISQKYGGPSIDMCLYETAEKKQNVPTGFVSIYPYNIINGENIKASESLKSFYGKVVKYIKKRSKLFRFTKRSVWIGNENNQEEIVSKLFK